MSRNSTAKIEVITTAIHKAYHVVYSNGKTENIHESTQPRRFWAVRRMIKGMSRATIGVGSKAIFEYTPRPRIIPLAEHFANAAVKAFNRLNPADVSSFESEAAAAESWVWHNKGAYSFGDGQIRRSITYRWYARSLISGKADRAALIAALDGID